MRIKTKLLIGAALVIFLAWPPGFAGAVFMTFDNLPLGNIEGQHLGTAPNGVTITSADNASTAIINGNVQGFGWLTPFNVVTNDGFLIGNTMTLTFDIDRGYVAFYGGDAGGDQDHFIAKAYNDSNVLVATFDSGVYGGNPLSSINYMVDRAFCEFVPGVSDIKYVTIEAFSVNGGLGILIDNLEFCRPVPVPPTALLLGSGLLGLVGFRFRRKRA